MKLHLPAAVRRRLSLALWLPLFCVFGGCALLGGEQAPGPASPARAATGPASAASAALPARPVVRVEVEAPDELRTLLDAHLDLSRLARLTRGDAVTDSELQRLVEAAPAQVRQLLETEGFFTPTTEVRRIAPAAAGQPETVRLQVTPGPRAVVSRITIEAEGALAEGHERGDARASATLADLRNTWSLGSGSVFRNSDWSSAKAAALTRLRSAGYATAIWAGTGAEVDRETHTVRLFLVADSGPLFRSGDIDVEGLNLQDLSTVQALAGFVRGTPVTENLLLDYQERLQKAGLFESVTVTLDPDPARAEAATVRVQLREQPTQVYTVGLGISANTGPRASVEHVYRRVFGYPVSSANKFELGRLRQAWTGEVSTHPGERSRRWLLGGTIERLVSSNDVVMSQRLRFGRAQDTPTQEQLIFAEVERGQRSTDANEVSTFAVSGNYHVVLRRLDSVLLPTEGYTLALQGGLGRSHGNQSKSGPFGRAYARLTYYQPLGRTWYGQARLEVGQVFMADGVAAPDSQRFRAGGDDSVRGYSYRSLGPVTDGVVGSGNVVLTGSLELARPVLASMPSLWGAVFIDAGRAANNFGSLTPAVGYGVGVRWRSPVGPLRLDLAWAEETSQVRLHFSVGIAF